MLSYAIMLKRIKKLIGDRNPIRLWYHFTRAFIAALINGFPARNLTVIGITGTDGKTTSVGMTAHILQKAGLKCGALSTAFLQIQDEIEWNETQKTSPSPFIIQKFLRDLVKQGCTHAVLEISSHGLVQGRVAFTNPSIAGITNTSAEHLDYHGTLEQYRKDKAKLFYMLREKGTKVMNRDDGSYEVLNDIPSEHEIEYSLKGEGNFWITDVSVSPDESNAILHQEDNENTWNLNISLPGSFNLENALCALSCAHAAGVSIDKSIQALQSFRGAPGRMERIDEGQPFSVFVDFTVTPEAYKKTLKALRDIVGTDHKILVLTGSCGDRMKEKRPEVGRICSDSADTVVVANEDPYTEDPQKIIDEVWAGVDETKCSAHQIFDRKEAITFILNEAKPGDAVILCGKGSDTTMWVKEGQIPWNEREIVSELLRSL